MQTTPILFVGDDVPAISGNVVAVQFGQIVLANTGNTQHGNFRKCFSVQPIVLIAPINRRCQKLDIIDISTCGFTVLANGIETYDPQTGAYLGSSLSCCWLAIGEMSPSDASLTLSDFTSELDRRTADLQKTFNDMRDKYMSELDQRMVGVQKTINDIRAVYEKRILELEQMIKILESGDVKKFAVLGERQL